VVPRNAEGVRKVAGETAELSEVPTKGVATVAEEKDRKIGVQFLGLEGVEATS